MVARQIRVNRFHSKNSKNALRFIVIHSRLFSVLPRQNRVSQCGAAQLWLPHMDADLLHGDVLFLTVFL